MQYIFLYNSLHSAADAAQTEQQVITDPVHSAYLYVSVFNFQTGQEKIDSSSWCRLMPLKEVRCSLCHNDRSRVSRLTCLSIRLQVQTQPNPLITKFECQTDAIVTTTVINMLQVI